MGVYRTAVHDRLDVPARVRLPEGDERAYRLLGRPIPQAIPIRLIIDMGAKNVAMWAWFETGRFRVTLLAVPGVPIRSDLAWRYGLAATNCAGAGVTLIQTMTQCDL